jgi:hypothetical protein
VLLHLNLIQSFAQTSNNLDTVRCYGITDLRKIATRFTEANLCDSLLFITENQLVNRDGVIVNKQEIINLKDLQLSYKDSIIFEKNIIIEQKDKEIKKEKIKHTLTKAGWVLTFLVLSFTTAYFFIH